MWHSHAHGEATQWPPAKRPRMDETGLTHHGQYTNFQRVDNLPSFNYLQWANPNNAQTSDATNAASMSDYGGMPLVPLTNTYDPFDASNTLYNLPAELSISSDLGQADATTVHHATHGSTRVLPGHDADPSQQASLGCDNNEIVCFGMVCGILGTYEQRGSQKLESSFAVTIDSSSRFSSDVYEALLGRIHNEYSRMVQGLIEEKSLDLHTVCNRDPEPSPTKKSKLQPVLPCSLDIVVYGPIELFDEIGDWFQSYEIYLQDPHFCPLDSRYCNPHRMSADLISRSMVSEIANKERRLEPQELPEPSDFLDILSSQIELEEATQPTAICSILQRHQKQALTFLLNREEGWAYDHGRPDIWEVVDTGHRRGFMNTVSRLFQQQEPTQFYGGIVADPMGLGKTLTMISLVAMDLQTEKNMTLLSDDAPLDTQDTTATLIIIPPPLLGSWEKQLNDHVVEGALTFRRHHGKTRINTVDELHAVNIVLTTYHTVAAEWKAHQSLRKSPLFAVRWRRIILDEAHFVRNGHSRMAIAVCALEAVSRWAVTGTPIQNRLGDLASLLKFIRVHPYTDTRQFESDISQLWKSGEDEEAVKRLKRLSACLLLRRAKTTIDLPRRRDLVHTIDFTTDERTVYDQIKQQAIAQIDEALEEQLDTRRSHSYVNVLQQIESLRLFSNLGLFYESRHEKLRNRHAEPMDWAQIAQKTFNAQREMSPITCLQCSSNLGLTDTLLDDTVPIAGKEARFTTCLQFICGDCTEKLSVPGENVPCGHDPKCQSAPVSTSSVVFEEVDNSSPSQLWKASTKPPSKIGWLIEDIKSVPADVKCVVFSTWRLTLDLIEMNLNREGIQSLRFDGSVPQKDRQPVVERFESDPDVRVMLLTLSCGAVGLTLTAASRAYLVEPHWNPTLEEQALARIHRLGQTREVTTVRLYMRDSFEEQVMTVQERKKQLAGVLLSPHDNEHADGNLSVLEHLRSLL